MDTNRPRLLLGWGPTNAAAHIACPQYQLLRLAVAPRAALSVRHTQPQRRARATLSSANSTLPVSDALLSSLWAPISPSAAIGRTISPSAAQSTASISQSAVLRFALLRALGRRHQPNQPRSNQPPHHMQPAALVTCNQPPAPITCNHPPNQAISYAPPCAFWRSRAPPAPRAP